MRRMLVAAVLVACRRGPGAGGGASPDASADTTASDAASGGTALVAARCHPTEQGVRIEEAAGADDLDIGDGLAHADGYAVGLVRRTPAGRVAAVALLGSDAGGVRIVDVGLTFGDAPAPRLASCRNQLVAAAFRVARAGGPGDGLPDGGSAALPERDQKLVMNRDLALYVVDARGPGQAVLSIPQHRDDSLAFDLACSGGAGLVVWDETAAAPLGGPARGVVRAASFEVGQRVAGVRDVSPPESDAEMPRVVADDQGFFVLWLARRAEPESADASRDIESPGEARAFGWLEMIALDAAGKATGPVRRLTRTSGHVSAYDVQVRYGEPKREILVVARDDEEAVDGAGGTLLRVRVRDDGAEAPLALPTDGLGRGAPTLVDAPAPWVAWVGPHEQLRMLPLDSAGEIAGAPSSEDGLDEARPLISLAAGRRVAGARSNPDDRLWVAAPADKTAQLRVFTCQR
jgi:hypothetical protein